MRTLALLLLLATPATADTTAAIDTHILPGVAAFAASVETLTATTQADCTRAAVLPAFRDARLAFAAIADLRVGPGEQAALNMAFWPDPRSSGLRALVGQIKNPVAIDLLPVSARGFTGLDLMLGDPALAYGAGDPGCTLVADLAADLQAQGAQFAMAWQDHAALMRTPGNLTYLDETEVRRVLFTQALASLELTENARLAEPLADRDRPRPTRAENWRTGLSLDIALTATREAVALAQVLADNSLPESARFLAEAETRAQTITDPGFQDIDDLDAWGRLFGLKRTIGLLHDTLEAEFGAATGLTPGFNAMDGD
jgi:uncharacterized protein